MEDTDGGNSRVDLLKSTWKNPPGKTTKKVSAGPFIVVNDGAGEWGLGFGGDDAFQGGGGCRRGGLRCFCERMMPWLKLDMADPALGGVRIDFDEARLDGRRDPSTIHRGGLTAGAGWWLLLDTENERVEVCACCAQVLY